jgi:hypothetical protein
MKTLLLSSSGVFAVLAVVLVSYSWRAPVLTLTLRHQFDDWHELLELFRGDSPLSPEDALDFPSVALRQAWCNFTLPPRTTRAPFCGCVERAARSYANSSVDSEGAIQKLVSCMSSRPAWKVKEFWAVRYATPAVYVFFIASTFLIVQSDVGTQYITVALWILAVSLVLPLTVADYIHNGFWGFTFFVVVLLETLVLLPGMSSSFQEQTGTMKRAPSCFWWAEYFSAPVFALYIPLMHCGRDFVFASVFTMIGTAIGGLGLRSFWCAEVYSDAIRSQFQSLMQRIVWLGILAACVTLSVFTAIYYHGDAPYAMGSFSVVMLVLTMLISLLQWPGNQDLPYLLKLQVGIAGLRNAMLFGVVVYDLSTT